MYSSAVVSDVVTAPFWLAGQGLLILCGWKLAERAFPQDSSSQKILHTSVFYCAFLLLAGQIPGFCGLLTPVILLLVLIAVPLAGLWKLSRHSAVALPEPLRPSRGSWLIETFWLVVVGLFIGHVIVHGLFRLPDDYDCLAYHMAFLDFWSQADALFAPASAQAGVPAGSELIGFWMTGLFSGDFLTPLNNIPIVIVWASATSEVLRQLGASRGWIHPGTLAVLAVHTLLHETDDASNDLMVAAFFTASAAYTLRRCHSDSVWDLSWFATALGTLAGVKYFALGYFALAAGGFGLMEWCRKSLVSSLKASSAVAVIACLFGSGWYLRNWLCLGHPLYPLGTSTGERVLAHPNIWETSFAGNGSDELLDWALFAIWRLGGPIHFAAVILMPALVAGLVMLAASRSNRSLSQLLQAIWLTGTFIIILITPFAVEDQPGTLNHLKWQYTPVRYGLCFLSFSVISFVTLLSLICRNFPVAVRRCCQAAFCGVLTWQIYRRITIPREFDFESVLPVGLICCVIFLAIAFVFRMNVRTRAATATLISLGLICGIGWLSTKWHRNYGPHFSDYFRTNAFYHLQDFERGQRIAALISRPYPLFGSARQHTVIQPRTFVDDDQLNQLVRDHNIELVAARKQRSQVYRYHGALESLQQQETRYRLKFDGPELKIFEVLPPAEGQTDD